jgi:hypothetical protein
LAASTIADTVSDCCTDDSRALALACYRFETPSGGGMQLRDRLRGGRMLAVLALSAGTALPLSAQQTAPPAGQAARMAAFTVADTSIAEALRRIDSGSSSWRTALDSVVAVGGSIVVATLRELRGVPEQFARGELAEATPIVAGDSTLATVFVVVNSELLERTYRLVASPRAERDADLMRILIHEIYGHAVPYLIAGHVRGQCPDPVDPRTRGCSINRENIVRAELRLGFRRSYQLSGLALYYYMRP